MKTSFTGSLIKSAVSCSLAVASSLAGAQAFPSKPIKVVVPFPAP